MIRVMVVDDEEAITRWLARVLARCNCTVDVSSTAEEAARQLEDGHYDVLVTDYSVRGMPPLGLLRRCAERSPGTRCIVLSATPPEHFETDDRDWLAHVVLTKPSSSLEILEAIGAPMNVAG